MVDGTGSSGGYHARTKSNPARLDEAIHVTRAAQEYDSVPGGIAFIPFELVVRDFNFSPDIDMRTHAGSIRTVIGDGRIGLAVADVDFIGEVSVSLTATRRVWHVRLHQRLVPFPNRGIVVNRTPLAEIAGIHNANHATERNTEDDALHFALLSLPALSSKQSLCRNRTDS